MILPFLQHHHRLVVRFNWQAVVSHTKQTTSTLRKANESRSLFALAPSRPSYGNLANIGRPNWPVTMAPSAAEAEDVVDLTDSPDLPAANGGDEADEDFRLAIALSLQQQGEDQAQMATKTGDGVSVPVVEPSQTPPSSAGLLGLDRKAMEAERLARLKRKRDASEDFAPERARTPVIATVRPVPGVVSGARISPPPLQRASAPAQKRAKAVNAPPMISKSGIVATSGSALSSTPHSSAPVTRYPNGIVLKTYAPGYPTAGTITFADLIAPAASLTSCLLSSFIWDFDWLFPHFNTKATSFLLVMHAKYPSQKAQIEADFVGIPNVKVCFPLMGGNVNCMHSKLMLLFYPERCRVVVPTANLMGFDWGVGSTMENMAWIIDLPLLDNGVNSNETKTEFEVSIRAFLRAQGIPHNVMAKLDLYDFKNTQDVRFVHTIGGMHGLDQWRDTGHCGLGKAVTSLGLATTEPINVDFVTSSVGSLNEEFMRSIYLACRGDDGLTEYTLRNAKTFPAKRIAGTGKDFVREDAGRGWRSRFQFYFPSHETVSTSNGGTESAGTICFSPKWWEGAKFPRTNMRECVSTRGGLLMHNKVRSAPETRHYSYACTDLALTRGLDHLCEVLPSRQWKAVCRVDVHR